MKSIEIKSLIALLVITMTLSARIMRETKAESKTARKSKAKTTAYNGDGSWAGGYNCPFIEVLNAQMAVAETSQKWSFKPTTITATNGFGFVMDGAVPPMLAKFVQVAALTQEKYVPWRFFDSVEYEKKTISYKMIVGVVRNDKGERATLRFNLPWAWTSDYIDVSQVNELSAKFSQFADAQKNNIKAAKNNIKILFGDLKGASKAQATAKQNDAQIKAQIEANIQKNQALLAERRKAIEAINKQIALAKPELDSLHNQLEPIISSMHIQEQLMINNDKLADDKQRALLFKGIDQRIAKELDDVVKDITTLKKLVANYNLGGVVAAAQSGSVEQVSQLLHKIRSAR